MDEWTELYRKETDDSSELGTITIHIKGNRVMVKIFGQTTMITRPSEEEADSAANTLVKMYKRFDDYFSEEDDLDEQV